MMLLMNQRRKRQWPHRPSKMHQTEKEGSYEDNPPAEVSTPTTTSESSTAEISGGKDGAQDAQEKKPISRSDTNHSSDENTLLVGSEPAESCHAIGNSNDGKFNELSDQNNESNKVELNRYCFQKGKRDAETRRFRDK